MEQERSRDLTASVGGWAQRRTVVVLAFDEVTLLDVAGPLDVFHMARRHLRDRDLDRYEVLVASVHGGSVRSSSGLPIATIALSDLDGREIDTLIVPGGGPPQDPPVPDELVAWIAQTGAQARRICAVCTGIFLVAQAGLAQGLRVTTHWMAAASLAGRFPQVLVDSDPIFVRDGRLWSSAGFTAGLDLSLALIEEDLGHETAMELARGLVMFMKRPGGQSQFSAPLACQSAGDPAFGKLHAWIMDHLGENLRVVTLADQVKMAPRTFARRYAEQIGRTPAKTIELLRLEAAGRQLLQTAAPFKIIAKDCGFGDEQNLRRTFMRHFGVSPQQYRERFGANPSLTSAIAAE